MDDRIKFITDIDTLVKLRFDYISTEIELSAEDREAYEANAPTYLSSVFYILFFAYGVRLRAAPQNRYPWLMLCLLLSP